MRMKPGVRDIIWFFSAIKVESDIFITIIASSIRFALLHHGRMGRLHHHAISCPSKNKTPSNRRDFRSGSSWPRFRQGVILFGKASMKNTNRMVFLCVPALHRQSFAKSHKSLEPERAPSQRLCQLHRRADRISAARIN